MEQICQYDVFEVEFEGIREGNPCLEREIFGEFRCSGNTQRGRGFYDGDGRYIVRYLPMYAGEYTYRVFGNFAETEFTGSFTALPHRTQNHGIVNVSKKTHFSYSDANPCLPLGTTCYVWHLQTPALYEETLETLAASPFRKIRFCVFPKHYVYNFRDPVCFPFEGEPMDASILTEENFEDYSVDHSGNHFDFSRFNPAYFRIVEKAIRDLEAIGIEADLILFHPYDRWGFSKMSREEDLRYLRYAVARFSAFHNVWWALANEYDLMPWKAGRWKEYGEFVRAEDPYGHLCSIHNCAKVYDHSEDWITHVSFQRCDLYRSAEETDALIEKYKKPVCLDELSYEGNLPFGWGNISPQELVRRFWEGALRGGYGGHSETYLHENGIVFWSHGGKLEGGSPARIAFLLEILESFDYQSLALCKDRMWDELRAETADQSVILFYHSFMRPSMREYLLPDGKTYQAEIYDTYEMTKEIVPNCSGKTKLRLPGKEYVAVLFRETV